MAAFAVAAGVLAPTAGTAAAQSGETVVRVTGPTAPVDKGNADVQFDVSADNVTNLGAFQFILTYNADVLEFVKAEKGDFIGSTGREVVCNPDQDAGSARFQCVTLRATPAGANGSGKLATITLKAIGSGKTDVNLDRVKLAAADIDASDISVTRTENTSLEVKGGSGANWLLWIIVIGVIALVVIGGGIAATRMRKQRAVMAPPPADTTGSLR